MIEPIPIQTLLTYLTLISVPVGVLYHIMTLRNTRKTQQQALETRQAQLFMNLYETWRSIDFRKRSNWINQILEYENYEDFWTRYGPQADPDAFTAWASIAAYYEGIGVLVKRGLIDIDLVYDLLHTGIKITWEKMSPEFLESREREGGHPRLWSTFEYLYNEIIKRGQHPELEA